METVQVTLLGRSSPYPGMLIAISKGMQAVNFAFAKSSSS